MAVFCRTEGPPDYPGPALKDTYVYNYLFLYTLYLQRHGYSTTPKKPTGYVFVPGER